MTVEVTSTTSPDISAHLQDSGEQLKNPSAQTIYWGIKLDRDLIETIQSIYPEWFKGYDLSKIMDSCKKAELTKSDGGTTVPSSKEASSTCLKEIPAEANGEDTSIGKTLGKNKETLKVKLMLRRPINELIDQGIMPTFKVPSGFQEQKKMLERSKDCEALKHKLQHRDVKPEVCNQHLTEDSDPDLQDMERQLKRAKLADPVKDNIIHKTIDVSKGHLQADKDLVDAINGGMLTFSRETSITSADGLHVKVEVADDPCNNSVESTSCPSLVRPDTSGAVAGFKRVNVFPQQVLNNVDQSMVVNGDITSLAKATLPSSLQITTVSTTSSFLSAQARATYSGNSQNNRLCKKKTSLSSPTQKQSSQLKSQSSKAKTTTTSSQPTFQSFQFHEYKGPPSSQKNSSGSNSQSSTTTTTVSPLGLSTSSTESSAYELLLQQQQLFLQWQLEWQNKYPQVVVPQAVKPVHVEKSAIGDDNAATPSFVTSTTNTQHENMIPLNTTTPTTSPTEKEMSPPRCLTGMKLDDLRVSDLRAELKKRSLPVSGSKPQLIERLKPFTDDLFTDKDQASDTPTNTVTATLAKTKTAYHTTKDRVSPVSPDSQQLTSPSAVSGGRHSATPVSPDSSALETISTTQAANIIINGNANVLKSPVLKSPQSPVSIQETPLRYSNGEGSFSAASLKRTLSSEFHCPASTPMEVDSTTSAVEKVELGETQLKIETVKNPQMILAANPKPQHAVTVNMKQMLVNEDLLKQQQEKIEKLEHELNKSQLALKQQKLIILRQQQAGLQDNISPQDAKMLQNLQLKQHILNQQHQKLSQEIQKSQQALIGPTTITIATSQPVVNKTKAKVVNVDTCPQKQSPVKKKTPSGSGRATSPSNSQATNKTKTKAANVNKNVQSLSGSKKKQPKVLELSKALADNKKSFLIKVSDKSAGAVSKSQSAKVISSPTKTTKVNLNAAKNVKSAGKKTDVSGIIVPPPPNYDEATKQLKTKQASSIILSSKNDHLSPKILQTGQHLTSVDVDNDSDDGSHTLPSVATLARSLSLPGPLATPTKCQAIDDVLEILIKSGELPPSAAQEPPATPKTTAAYLRAANTFANSFTPSAMQPLPGFIPSSESSSMSNFTTSLPMHIANNANNILMDFSLNMEFPDSEFLDFSTLEQHIASLHSADSSKKEQGEYGTPQLLDQQVLPMDTSGSPDSNEGGVSRCESEMLLSKNVNFDAEVLKCMAAVVKSHQHEVMSSASLDNQVVKQTTDSHNSRDGSNSPQDLCANNISKEGSSIVDQQLVKTICLDNQIRPSYPNLVKNGNDAGQNSTSAAVAKPQQSNNEFHIEVSDISDAEPETGNVSNMDLSDWLDIIMPSTGIMPLSNNAPITLGNELSDVAAFDAESSSHTTPTTSLAQNNLTMVPLDLLSDFEEMDFSNGNELSHLHWDKVDITT